MRPVLAIIFMLAFLGFWTAPLVSADEIPVETFARLTPLHLIKSKPEPQDWLAAHPEPGQTFEEYTALNPPRPDSQHGVIYITLLGDFDPLRREIIEKAARYFEAFYGLPVRFMAPVSEDLIPARARRVHPVTQDPQVLSSYVIDEILLPRKPDDAYCLIAFTSSDLWPGAGWNFVFGQASMVDRVGVWSVYRNGDPNLGKEEYQLCLRRTISTGIHEIGHMFFLLHCIYYECTMNGSNHRLESDRRPLWLCPVCLRKLCWLLNINLLERYQNLAKISQELGLEQEALFFRESIRILKQPKDKNTAEH